MNILHARSLASARHDQIPALRQTILNLAVRGKLVAQDFTDAPACSFGIVDCGQADRLKMILPSTWNWARVGDVAEARLGKMLDKAKNSGGSYRYLRNTNVHWFNIRLDDLKEIRIEDNELDKYVLKKGDVLICEGGHGIGRTAIWKSDEIDVVFQKALHRVRPGHDLNSNFFSYCIFVYSHFNVLQSYFTGVGIPHFTGRALSELVFPLPPLAEQRRIVAKVEELMEVCDRLETQLITAQDESCRLLDAMLHKALSTESQPDIARQNGRTLIAAYAVSKLRESTNFGRTELVKTLYLTEAHVGVPLNIAWKRMAAGPHNPVALTRSGRRGLVRNNR